MHVLFIHQAFPAQFGALGLALRKRYGWQCSYLVDSLAANPTPTLEMVEKLTVHQVKKPVALLADKQIPWPQTYGHFLDRCVGVYDNVRSLPGPKPDLVVCHDGLGPGLFLPDLLDCPIVNYCEYYFAPRYADISYRVDLPDVDPAHFYPRCINAGTLVSLVDCTAAYAPTEWQKRSFPQRFWPKIEVHFDGVDTELYRPGRVGRRNAPRLLNGRSVPEGTRIVTFAARGMESIRGFDLFLRVAQRIARERSDVLFVVVGGDEVYYSWDKLFTGEQSFREWAQQRYDFDPSRLLFTGTVQPDQFADLLSLSDLHLYLTVPFVAGWSLFDALASGCVVLAGDVGPVRELVEPGRTGLVAPLFDTEAIAEAALRVLDDPAAFRSLGQAGRKLVEERYSMDVCVPELHDYLERMSERAPCL